MSSDRAQRAARNVVVSIASQLIGWALTFAVTLYLPRYVGSAGLGEMAAASAFVSVFGVVVSLGTSNVLTKTTARNPNAVSDLLATGIFLRVPIALIMAALIILVSRFVGYSELGRSLIIIYVAIMVATDANDILSAILQGQEKIARQSTNALIGKVVSSGLTILMIALHRSIIEVTAVGLVAGVLLLALNAASFRGLAAAFRVPQLKAVINLACSGLPFLGWSVFQTLYGQTDPLVLKFVSNPAAIGWYAVAFRLVGTTLFFPSAVASALLPSLSALYAENSYAEFSAIARRLFQICLLMAMPVFVIFLAIPQELMRFLHYPDSFAGAIPVLRVAGAGCLLYFIAIALGTVVIASDGQVKMLRASVVAAIVGLPACVAASWFTEHVVRGWWGGHNAAVGAMASDVLLEAILIGFYIKAAPRGTYGRTMVLYVARIVAAGLPMGLILLTPVANALGIWRLIPALVIYIGACFAFGGIDAKFVEASRLILTRIRRSGT